MVGVLDILQFCGPDHKTPASMRLRFLSSNVGESAPTIVNGYLWSGIHHFMYVRVLLFNYSVTLGCKSVIRNHGHSAFEMPNSVIKIMAAIAF